MVLEHDGRGRPLPMAVRREPGLATASALLAGGERRLRALPRRCRRRSSRRRPGGLLDPDGDTLRDIDTEADLGLIA